ncbi:hypothetical protein E4H12_14015 [Candidatus Thorarchaeota archaeon]|nr:MAG: hypothetical protein E4H12_14015 [Candidatus Thorarchaeota archaeon]
MQADLMEWFSQNLLLTVGILFILQVVLLAIYAKLFVRIIQEGTTYRHYRKGRLLRESIKGGMVVLLPFLDKLEIIPPVEPTLKDTNDYFDDKESE